jgi:hypothetical protein
VAVEPDRSSFALVVIGSSEVGAAGTAGDLGETGYAEVHGGVAADGDLVHLGEFAAGSGQADLQAFGFAEPTVGFGFGDAGLEVVEDLGEAATLVGVGSQQGAAQAAVLVDAWCVVGTAAVTDSDLAAFEVAEELGPLLVSWGAIFLAGTQSAAPGDERPVTVNDLFGVDGYPMVVLMSRCPATSWAMWGGIPCIIASVMNSLRKSWKV